MRYAHPTVRRPLYHSIPLGFPQSVTWHSYLPFGFALIVYEVRFEHIGISVLISRPTKAALILIHFLQELDFSPYLSLRAPIEGSYREA